MNERLSLIGSRLLLGACVLSLAACAREDGTARQGLQSERLAPCTADGSPFADLPFETWAPFYHNTVLAVTEAHIQSLGNVNALPLQCTAEDYEELVPASEPLQALAATLPAYRDAESLTEVDMAPVLLEFLRVYECSMKQRKEYLSVYIPREYSPNTFMRLGDFFAAKSVQNDIMEKEMRVSRLALERTLGLIGGFDRLRPLSLDIECIKRASLDLRNVLGLASDASSCLPRAWDTHGSLRDLQE